MLADFAIVVMPSYCDDYPTIHCCHKLHTISLYDWKLFQNYMSSFIYIEIIMEKYQIDLKPKASF